MSATELSTCETHLINEPLVSIITPVLNGMRYLEDCIQSVLNQSYPHIEHIFIDGGSTDGTLELLSKYHTGYPDRIRFISGQDSGVGEAVNKGFALAKGQVLGWLDSDDLYEQNAIREVVACFKANPDTYVVYGGCNIIDEKGTVTGKLPVRDFSLREAIRDRHYIALSAAFYRREVIDSVGGFNSLGNDLDFWLRVGRAFKMHHLDKPLSNWRLHSNSITTSRTAARMAIVRQRFREDYVLCRYYGGGLLAPRCRRYYIFVLLYTLGLYHVVNFGILARLRRYPFAMKVLRALGA